MWILEVLLLEERSLVLVLTIFVILQITSYFLTEKTADHALRLDLYSYVRVQI